MNISYLDLEKMGITDYEEEDNHIIRENFKNQMPNLDWNNMIELKNYTFDNKRYFINKINNNLYKYFNNNWFKE